MLLDRMIAMIFVIIELTMEHGGIAGVTNTGSFDYFHLILMMNENFKTLLTLVDVHIKSTFTTIFKISNSMFFKYYAVLHSRSLRKMF